MAPNFQDSVNAVIGLLPADGSEMLHSAWREKTLSSGTSGGEEALRRIFKTKLANFRIAKKEGDVDFFLYVSRKTA